MTDIINGYVVKTTRNPEWKAYSFHYFTNKRDAIKFARSEKKREEDMMGKGTFYRIEPIKLQKCMRSYCNKLTEPNQQPCLRCEKIEYDARFDKYPEEMEENDDRERWEE